MVRKALNPITLATIIVILYTTVPVVSIFTSTYVTTYAYMLISAFLIIYIMLTGGLKRMGAILYLVIPLVTFIAFTYVTLGASLLLWGYQSMLFILPTIIGYYFLNYRPESIKIFAWTLIIALIITTVTTITGLIMFPNASRILATIAESDDPENLKYTWRNIGGYDFVYTCVLLYPVLILARKLNKIHLVTFLVLTAAIFMLVIASEYTIAFILMVITSVLYFSSKKLNSKHLLIFGIIMFLSLFIFWDVFKNLLLWFASIVNSESISERLTALAGGITSLENFEDNRLELYRMSLNGFLSSPIFGQILGATTSHGGHSFVLDSLANYGLVGAGTLVLAYRNIYRFFFNPFRNEQGYGFVLWAFAQTIILSLVNTGMWLNVLTFFIPVILTVIYNSSGEDEYEDSLGS